MRRLYAAFASRDVPAALGLLAEDVDFYSPGPVEVLELAGRRRGRAEVAAFFAGVAETCEFEVYTVTFNREITDCAWLATLSDSPSSQNYGVGVPIIHLLDEVTLAV